MGYRLEGPPLKHLRNHNIVSDGTANGCIQVPGDGQPIVLMPDRGTTGGYPKIATIISADIARFAQMPIGSAFRFAAVSVTDAQNAARILSAELHDLPKQLYPAGRTSLNVDAMQDANIGGSVVNADDDKSWQAGTNGDATP